MADHTSGFGRAPRHLLRNPAIPPAAKALFSLMACETNFTNGQCLKPNEWLARHLPCAERYISKYRKILRAYGYITGSKRRGSVQVYLGDNPPPLPTDQSNLAIRSALEAKLEGGACDTDNRTKSSVKKSAGDADNRRNCSVNEISAESDNRTNCAKITEEIVRTYKTQDRNSTESLYSADAPTHSGRSARDSDRKAADCDSRGQTVAPETDAARPGSAQPPPTDKRTVQTEMLMPISGGGVKTRCDPIPDHNAIALHLGRGEIARGYEIMLSMTASEIEALDRKLRLADTADPFEHLGTQLADMMAAQDSGAPVSSEDLEELAEGNKHAAGSGST